MSMFSIFNVSGSAVSAQSQRLNVVASNLANADAVAGPDGEEHPRPLSDASGREIAGGRVALLVEVAKGANRVADIARRVDADG